MTAPVWWEATRERRLLIQHCTRCRKYQHYPRVVCTGCGGDDLVFVEAAGDGVIDSFTVVERAEAPYTLARVRLTEGPIVLTHLDGIDDPRCDQTVHLAWRALPDGRHLPVFRSADDGL
ncbi:Zn-ribbon domain-containing OB-fold protein [Actinoplanes sp. CA-142083]|uniref:Zn-ribbon domain-containing OB-fold protein n=1 Tax=Actinoplanes sp. CA-142083 TaxID=3239903 RepID=UPI003D8E59B7